MTSAFWAEGGLWRKACPTEAREEQSLVEALVEVRPRGGSVGERGVRHTKVSCCNCTREGGHAAKSSESRKEHANCKNAPPSTSVCAVMMVGNIHASMRGPWQDALSLSLTACMPATRDTSTERRIAMHPTTMPRLLSVGQLYAHLWNISGSVLKASRKPYTTAARISVEHPRCTASPDGRDICQSGPMWPMPP